MGVCGDDEFEHRKLKIAQDGTFPIPVNLPGIDDVGISDGRKVIRPVGAKKVPIGVEVLPKPDF